jgi:hypothetical protein
MRKPSRPRTKPQPSEQDTISGDVIPPGQQPPGGIPPAVYAEIVAQINQYTDRPDLLIEVIEKHDPGFIQSMNAESREFSRKSRNSRFNFGRVQAYTSLTVQVGAAATILYVVVLMAQNNSITLSVIVGLGVLFAITQSGMSGFMRIVSQISKFFSGNHKR